MSKRTITRAQYEDLAGWLEVAQTLNECLNKVFDRAIAITQEPQPEESHTFDAVFTCVGPNVDQLLQRIGAEVEKSNAPHS